MSRSSGNITVSWKYVVLLIIGVGFTSCQKPSENKPIASNGSIDFSQWDFEHEGVANLNGEWNFYWGAQISKTNEINGLKHQGTCKVPGFWAEEVSENTYFEQYGITTFHLHLTLPDTVETYALKLNSVYTSYELWANGKQLTKVGKVGETETTSVPNFHTRLIQLPPQKEVDLFLSIASWEHRRGGGIPEPILIGTESQLHALWLKNHDNQVFYFAFIIGLGIYLITLYLFYPENKSYFYFGLFAFLSAMRAGCIDEMIMEHLLNDIPYYWNQRIRYIGFFAAVGCIILYIESLFKEYTHKLHPIGGYLLVGFSASVFIIPFRWATYLSPLFQLVAFLWIMGCFHLYFKAKAYKKTENIILILGGAIGAAVAIHHMLVANNLIESEYYHNLGIALYIFTQVLSLAYGHRRVYYKANQLSKDLLALNKNLENKVELRTVEIREQAEELKSQRDRIGEQAEELQGVNDKLQELDKMKTRFFANISHELRTPLTLILGGLSNIKQELNPKHKNVQLIEKQSNLLHQLINQLLDLSKLESGKMELHPTEQPIIRLLRGYLYSFESLTILKKIKLTFKSNVEERFVLIDRQALEKIMYNLLSNAYKFTSEMGVISLEVVVLPQKLQFSISDTGIGIPEKLLPHLFDRFYQVDDSLIKNYEGTGIGLALVKELVDLHEGEIRVNSQVDAGTTFSIELPVTISDQPIRTEVGGNEQIELKQLILPTPTETTPSEETKDSTSAKPILLIVEDHPDLQELISDEFKSEYQVLNAYDGKKGCELAIQHIPDLIISDVMMPAMNGYELCQQLKKDERTSHIPIILLTARIAQENKMEGLEAGADNYLSKPFDIQELRIRVQNLIHSRQLMRERFSKQQNNVVFNSEELTNNVDKSFMDKFLGEIELHYADEKYRIEQLAETFNISARQLNRKLNAMTGLSAKKMLQNFRLQKAVKLLGHPDLQVQEVGFKVGFSSAAYFTTYFKEKFGKTPKEYRKTLV